MLETSKSSWRYLRDFQHELFLKAKNNKRKGESYELATPSSVYLLSIQRKKAKLLLRKVALKLSCLLQFFFLWKRIKTKRLGNENKKNIICVCHVLRWNFFKKGWIQVMRWLLLPRVYNLNIFKVIKLTF